MAIKVYGDKIVFPDNTEQTTAPTQLDGYSKAEIDAQQEAQDVKIDKNSSDLTNVYTKEEVDNSQSEQDTEISKKIEDAPNDNETYARNNSTWVSIGGSSGIPDAPVDGVMYGRKDGDWNPVADAGNVYTKTETNDLLDDKADKSTTYTKSEVDLSQQSQDSLIQANADAIANLPTPVDTYTKAEIDASQNAQDVEIAKKANTDDTYTKTQTDTLLDSKANVGDSYTKAETYTKSEVDASQAQQNEWLDLKADKSTTYTKTEVDASQGAQDTKIDKNKTDISSNTSAIGTLSGRVSANEQDIATLQDGVFFSSSYTANYPDNPNRDPETGNIYLQNISAFTYSYADANQVFISKTDEQGNVRQFTAVKPDDTLVLNQVESPNYGRYKVTAVNDVGDYVNIIMEFQIGEGTVLEGDTIALQAFPASEGGDSIWTEVDGVAIYDGAVDLGTPELEQKLNVYNIGTSKYGFGGIPNFPRMYFPSDGNLQFGTMSKDGNDTFTSLMQLSNDGTVSTTKKDKQVTIDANVGELGLKSRITTDASILELKAGSGGLPDVTISDSGLATETDITVNGMTVGASPSQKNTYVGKNALSSVTNGMFVTAVGEDALKNSADGGAYNTAIGYNAGGNLTTGSGNICIGYQAEASSPTVTNEVTIGNDDITKTRLKGAVTNTHSSGAEVKLYDGTVTTKTTRSDLNVAHHSFQDETGQVGVIRSLNGSMYFDGLVTTFAQVEGLEAKLSAKDKLIEKLSARLDELEKKLK